MIAICGRQHPSLRNFLKVPTHRALPALEIRGETRDAARRFPITCTTVSPHSVSQNPRRISKSVVSPDSCVCAHTSCVLYAIRITLHAIRFTNPEPSTTNLLPFQLYRTPSYATLTSGGNANGGSAAVTDLRTGTIFRFEHLGIRVLNLFRISSFPQGCLLSTKMPSKTPPAKSDNHSLFNFSPKYFN
jgi:hypothetical protein